MPAIPWMALLVFMGRKNRENAPLSLFFEKIIPAAFLAAFAFFSVAGTHDYLAWNRARWEGLRSFEAQNIPADRIDGGFEFNYWHSAGKEGSCRPDWHLGDEYTVGLSPIKEYRVIREIPFKKWLPPYKKIILVMKKKETA